MADKRLTIYMCAPKDCPKHIFDKDEPIVEDGKVRGATKVCSNCGQGAFDVDILIGFAMEGEYDWL